MFLLELRFLMVSLVSHIACKENITDVGEGMAKAVADTDSGSNQGGFTTDGSNITGFSSMHDSGTGGSPSLGNFPLFPQTMCEGDDVNGCVCHDLLLNMK